MVKWLALIIVICAWNFSQLFWLEGLLFADSEVSAPTSSEQKSKALQNSTPDVNSFGNLFGAFQSTETEQVEQTKEELFVEKNQAYIGQLGNFQYILYATAKLSGTVSAKVLVNDIETQTVTLVTVFKNDQLNQANITSIDLSKLVMTQGKDTIELKLFERS